MEMGGVAITVTGLLCCLLLIQVDDALCRDFKSQAFVLQVNNNPPYRTSYHFQPPKNWMNDPTGPMLYMGVYHLFYQYNPSGPLFDDGMVWAHSVSYDLINWIHLEHALCPDKPFDAHSCWSGSVTILPGNRPVILYTGIDSDNRQVQNLAFPKNLSDPFLVEWVKYSENPVINLPEGVAVDKFRDPTTAWQGPDGKWRVAVGSLGKAFLYSSEDFINWTLHQDPLYSLEIGEWECPDFYPVSIDGTNGVDTSVINPSVKHVMKTGILYIYHDYYFIGTYSPALEQYVPENEFTGTNMDLRYNYGKYYASKTFFDNVRNRRIMWAWVNESDSSTDAIEKGWSGLQAFPRQVWLHKDGKQLVQWPIDEINQLHSNQVRVHHVTLDGGQTSEVKGITASQADVEIEFELPEVEEAEFLNLTGADPQKLCTEADASVRGKYGPFGLLVLATEDLTEQTAVFFRIFKGQNGYVMLMCSDQSRSSLRENLDKVTYGAFINIDPQLEKITLRTLIDHSIVESFGAEGRTCITARVYPKFAVGEQARLYAFNNGTLPVTISRLEAWSMNKAQIKTREAWIDEAQQMR